MSKESFKIQGRKRVIKKPREVASILPVNQEGGGLDLYCTLKLDGEVVTPRFKSESFLSDFAYWLAAHMHGGTYERYGFAAPRTSISTSNAMNISTYFTISSHSKTNPLRINTNVSEFTTDVFRDYTDEHPSRIILTGCADRSVNGMYHAARVDDNTIDLYNLDGSPFDGTAIGDINTGYFMDLHWINGSAKWRLNTNSPRGAFNTEMLQCWQVIVGQGADPVDINDFYLQDRHMWGTGAGQLQHGAIAYSAQITDKPSSRYTLSKSFTNQSGADITVAEIGINSGFGNDSSNSGYNDATGPGLMIVRDVLGAPVLIPNGSTLTVDYEVVVRLDPDTVDTDADGTNGGFVQSFMTALRTQGARTSNEVFDLSNYFFCSKPVGQTNPIEAGVDSNFGEKLLGLRLGQDNTFTSMTDTTLNLPDGGSSGFEHGEEDGQLYYYGTVVEPVVIDNINNKASFAVTTIVENRSSIAAVVKEKGLWSIVSTNNTTSSMIARIALGPADQFTIQPGEIYKVKLIIEVAA